MNACVRLKAGDIHPKRSNYEGKNKRDDKLQVQGQKERNTTEESNVSLLC